MRKPFLAVVAASALGVAAVPAHAATTTVLLKDNVFSPKAKTVSKNDTVKFVWRGKAPHNVKVVSGPVKFTSKIQKTGTFSRRMTRTGTYKIVCTIHSGMNFTLRVK